MDKTNFSWKDDGGLCKSRTVRIEQNWVGDLGLCVRGWCEEGNWSEDREESKFQGASGNQVGDTEHEHNKDVEFKF